MKLKILPAKIAPVEDSTRLPKADVSTRSPEADVKKADSLVSEIAATVNTSSMVLSGGRADPTDGLLNTEAES